METHAVAGAGWGSAQSERRGPKLLRGTVCIGAIGRPSAAGPGLEQPGAWAGMVNDFARTPGLSLEASAVVWTARGVAAKAKVTLLRGVLRGLDTTFRGQRSGCVTGPKRRDAPWRAATMRPGLGQGYLTTTCLPV